MKWMRTVLVLVCLLLPAAPVASPTKRRAKPSDCANLIYAGTKSSVCFSEEFLSTVASETSINTSRKFKPVKLAEKEIFHFPFRRHHRRRHVHAHG